MTDMSVANTANAVTDRELKVIWDGMLTKSVRELADATGLPVPVVLQARNDALEAVDALTVDQRRTRLLIRLQALAEKAEEEFESTTDARSKAPLLSAATGAIKTVLQELRKMDGDSQTDIERLNAMRRREVVNVYRDTSEPFIAWLVDEYSVDADHAQAKYEELLSASARAMDERNAL